MSRRGVARTCIGCRERRDSGSMVRVCVGGEGRLFPATKSEGRGLWICRSRTCFELASAKGRVERALRIKAVPDVQDQLLGIYEVLGF